MTEEPVEPETDAPAPTDEAPSEPVEPETDAEAQSAEAPSSDVGRELRVRSRRGFIVAGVAAAAGYGAWRLLDGAAKIGGVQWPLRRAFEFEERLTEAYFKPSRLSPTFSTEAITRARINGGVGLGPDVGAASWRLRVEGIDGRAPSELTLDDIKALPRNDMITELRCIEGWSIVVHWTGARLTDLMARLPPPRGTRYVAMETPGRGYYVGLDMESAMHPQTLLAYEINGQPLSWQHGAPLRLAIPIKYGIKNIKRIATIRYTNIRPADFWAERGYDWYAGH